MFQALVDTESASAESLFVMLVNMNSESGEDMIRTGAYVKLLDNEAESISLSGSSKTFLLKLLCFQERK